MHQFSPPPLRQFDPHGALSLPVAAYRLTETSHDPLWLGDDLGSAADPRGPRMTRREFFVRAAVATSAIAVGGALNVLTTSLARQSLASNRP
jgi:hypothetical protein